MTTALDPADAAFARDPYPFYAALREQGRPAAPVALSNGTSAWLVTGYRQARTVLADPRFSNVPAPKAGPRKAEGATAGARSVLEQHMLNTDGAEHRRLRRLASVAFTPRRVDALTGRIAALTDSVLAELTARAGSGAVVDLVDGFAFPLPVLVISEILGVPEQDRLDLRTWTYRVGSPAGALAPGELDQAWQSLHRYFAQLIAEKRRRPGEDLFSLLARDEDEAALDDGELLAMAFLLLFAGYETTMNLLASAALLLLDHPDELRAARQDAGSGWAAVIEETLRHASPLEGTTWRRASEEVDLGGGTVVPAGASVLVVLAAANRDPDVFTDPDAFRPGRYAPGSGRALPHLAFGHGPHVCLGARLARLEAEVALPRLFDALPDLRLAADPGALPYRPGLLVRGPRTVPVRRVP
ncbi:cytochrome P450 [Kitasatospora sp. A2-31]|uniref:cytochrome P450 family protein n=1 Tax=Kitasatospora sp. A2-31 TaxID=2916414 RepID=UPI001EEA08AA|nr:cytochrome P450 [Kitasatospora sp. A2-31]MCG6494276.1 cytochrome P450 [Kitasatospora sp. A2-31]